MNVFPKRGSAPCPPCKAKVWRLYIPFIVVLVLLLPSRPEITDEDIYQNMSRNIFSNGVPVYSFENGKRVFTRFSPLYPTFLALYRGLIYFPGRLVYALTDPPAAAWLNWGLMLLFNVFVGIIIVVLVSRIEPRFTAAWLLLFLSSNLLFYSGTLFMEMLLGLLFLAAVIAFERKMPIVGYLVLAISVMAKSSNLVFVPVFIIFDLYRRRSVRAIIQAVGLGLLLSASFHLIWNYISRGNPLDFGYVPRYFDPTRGGYMIQGFNHPLARGIFGLLFSPGKSFFLYNPWVVPALGGIIIGLRERPIHCGITLVLFVQTLLLYGSWSSWEGGLSFGPRFLVPLLPLFFTGVLFLKRRGKILLVTLALAGFFINFSARAVQIYQIYVDSGCYGSGLGFILRYNFFADQVLAFVKLLLGRGETYDGLWLMILGKSRVVFYCWTGIIVVCYLLLFRRAVRALFPDTVSGVVEKEDVSG